MSIPVRNLVRSAGLNSPARPPMADGDEGTSGRGRCCNKDSKKNKKIIILDKHIFVKHQVFDIK